MTRRVARPRSTGRRSLVANTRVCEAGVLLQSATEDAVGASMRLSGDRATSLRRRFARLKRSYGTGAAIVIHLIALRARAWLHMQLMLAEGRVVGSGLLPVLLMRHSVT